MSVQAVLDELPLPLPPSGESRDLGALAIGMVLESEFGLILNDDELTPGELGTPGRVLALLARHGVTS